jgi:hypothetical protein
MKKLRMPEALTARRRGAIVSIERRGAIGAMWLQAVRGDLIAQWFR